MLARMRSTLATFSEKCWGLSVLCVGDGGGGWLARVFSFFFFVFFVFLSVGMDGGMDGGMEGWMDGWGGWLFEDLGLDVRALGWV